MDPLSPKFLILYVFVGCAIYVHFRGKERLKFTRQLTDHSTFMAPYNVLAYLFSAVPNEPILPREAFPELDVLRDNWRSIREEALRLQGEGRIRRSDRYDDLAFNSFFKRGWKRFYLKWYGECLPSAKRECPETVRLLEQVPSVKAAMFALLAPDSRLVRHRDPFAGSLRYHLGLSTPNSDLCRIFIDGQPYAWKDGEDIVFDETYIHRAENRTDEPRIIFFCDVERPMRFGLPAVINRFVGRFLVSGATTRNEPQERIGFLNWIFGGLYHLRLVAKKVKGWNQPAYYGLKFVLLGLALYLVLA